MWQGRDVPLYKNTTPIAANGTASTPYNNAAWSRDFTVGSGDVIQRGALRSLAIDVTSDQGGTAYVYDYGYAGTSVVGTIASHVMAGTSPWQALVGVASAAYFGFALINGASSANPKILITGRSEQAVA